MVTHRILEGDDLATVLTAANLPQAQPGQTVYRLMNDGSYQIQVVASDLSLSTLLSLPQSVLNLLPMLNDADGVLTYAGRPIEGLTPAQIQFLSDSTTVIDALEARLAVLENVAPDPIVPTIQVVTAPKLIDASPVPSGTTFAEFVEQRIDKGLARVVGADDDEFQYIIDIQIDPISTGTDPMTGGDVISGGRPSYHAQGLESVERPVVQFLVKVPKITSTIDNEAYDIPEGEALQDTALYDAITDPTQYASNVGSIILGTPVIEEGAVDLVTPLEPGEVTVSISVTDTAGTTPVTFTFAVFVLEAPAVEQIVVTKEPTLSLLVEDGDTLSTALDAGTATLGGVPVVPTIAFTLDEVEADPGDVVVAAEKIRATVTYSAAGADDVVRNLGPVTVKAAVVVDTGTSASSMTFDGSTAFFTEARPVGTYADDSKWASSSDGANPVSITELSPASASGVVRSVGTSSTTGPTVVNGTQVDPGKGMVGGTLAQRQSVNDGTTKGQTHQSYDSFTASNNLPFSASGNVDPGATGQPLVLTEGTICKAISKLSGVQSQARPPLEKMVPFTVVRTPPLVGSFRPGHSSPSKESWLTVDDIDITKLPNIAASGLAIPTFSASQEKLKFLSWQHTYNANSRNVLSPDGRGWVYGGSRDEWMFMILALCYNVWTPAQKLQIVKGFVQIAIDITARIEQGGIFQENGGHAVGQKTIVALAAHLTGHPRFIAALNATTTLFVHSGGTASVWAEDRQIFRVSQADVNRRQKYQFNYPASMIGTAEWSSDATRDDPDAASNFRERLNSLNVNTAGAAEDLRQSYRHLVAAVNVPAALALRLMGAHVLMGADWLEYQDRHMAARVALGSDLPDNNGNPINPFVLAAWVRDRSKAETGVGTPPPTGDTGGDPDPTPPPPPPPPPDPETPPVVDTSTTGVVFTMNQSEWVYLTNTASYYRVGTVPDLVAENFTFIGYNGAFANAGSVVKVKLTQANRTSVNPCMVYLANALAYAAPGKQFVLGAANEEGSSFISLVSDNTAFPRADGSKYRAWSNTQRIVDRLMADYGHIDRLTTYWYAADSGYMPDWLNAMAPGWFGQLANGSTFTLGTNHSPAGTTIDNCIYDFSSSGPTVKGRGLLPRTVPYDMVPKSNWADDTHGDRAGVKLFYEDDRFEALGGYYGPPWTGTYGGHPTIGDDYGQYEAIYVAAMATFLRVAGYDVKPSGFVGITTNSAGTVAEANYQPRNGGVLSTTQRVRGGARKQDMSKNLSQDVWGFEIERTSGGGKYWIARVGAVGVDPKYQGTVTWLSATKAKIVMLQPLNNGDKISFHRGHAHQRTDANHPVKNHTSDSASYHLGLPLEYVAQFTDPNARFPYAGIMADLYSPEWSVVRGGTAGAQYDPALNVLSGVGPGGGTTTPPADTAPVRTAQPTISGSPATGMTRTLGGYTGNPTPTVSGGWFKNDAAISGATSATYTAPSPADGDTFDWRETATNGVSPNATGTSNVLTHTVAPPATNTPFTMSGSGPVLTDPSNVPSGTTKIRHNFKFRVPSGVTNTTSPRYLAVQQSGGFNLRLIVVSGGVSIVVEKIEDSREIEVHPYSTRWSGGARNTWYEIDMAADLENRTLTMTVNGVAQSNTQFYVADTTTTFYNGRPMTWFALDPAGNSALHAGVEIEYFDTYFKTNGVETLRKHITGPAATVNADPWKSGGNAT